MALVRKIEVDFCTNLYVWNVIEKEQELEQGLQLSEDCKKRLDEMKLSQMRSNFLAVRQILKLDGYKCSDLYYSEVGKPFLKDGKEISISHSYQYVVVIISTLKVGVDIEKKRKKILEIAHKFTNWSMRNSSMSSNSSITKLTKTWSAKEAIYKVHNKKGLSLKNQIHIRNFFPMDNITYGKVEEENGTYHYKIHFLDLEEMEGFVICYCFLE